MANNQLKKGVILSYAILILNILVQLFYTPIVLKLLGQSEYGLYQLVASLVSYLSMLSFGLTGSYVKFYSRYKIKNDEQSISKLNGLFIIVFSIIACICVIVGLGLTFNVELFFKRSLSSQEIGTAQILMIVLIINMAISFPSSVIDCYIVANEKYVFQRALNLIKIVAGPVVTIPLLLVGYKSIAVVSVTTMVSIIVSVISGIYAIGCLKMKFAFLQLPKGLFKEIFVFSSFIFINIIVDQINWNTDKFLLGILSGTVSVAVYGVASQINNLFTNFSTTISSVFTPRINLMVEENIENNEISNLFIKVGRVQFIVLSYLLLNIIFLGKYFICIWAGKEYEQSYYVLLCLVIPAIIPLIQNLGIEIQRAMNMHKFRSYVYIALAIVNVLCSIPFIKLFGAVGAAFGTAISLLLGNGIVMNWFYYKKMKLNIPEFWKQILKMCRGMILPIIIELVYINIVGINSLYTFGFGAILLLIVYFFSMWFWGINLEEKDLFRKMFAKVRRK